MFGLKNKESWFFTEQACLLTDENDIREFLNEISFFDIIESQELYETGKIKVYTVYDKTDITLVLNTETGLICYYDREGQVYVLAPTNYKDTYAYLLQIGFFDTEGNLDLFRQEKIRIHEGENIGVVINIESGEMVCIDCDEDLPGNSQLYHYLTQ